ncbi:MAG: TatD family hydrolase [Thermoanaerobaculia bacterium]
MRSGSLVDSHCHLQHLAAGERRAALDRARERGVRGFLVPATELTQADDLLALCHSEEGVWCALGVHPHDAAAWRAGDAERLRELAVDPRVVAIGECGLDFFYDHAPREVQERVFRAQCEVALDLGLPVVVHNRDSNERMVALLADPALAGLAADLHSFAGGLAMARELLPLATVFGLSGMITFPRADNVREILRAVPRDRLLVETDTPYLAPVPHRGKGNEPAYVVEVAARLAAEWGATSAEVAARTSENFFRFFARAAPGGGST